MDNILNIATGILCASFLVLVLFDIFLDKKGFYRTRKQKALSIQIRIVFAVVLVGLNMLLSAIRLRIGETGLGILSLSLSLMWLYVAAINKRHYERFYK